MIQYVFDWGDGSISTSTLFYSGATGYAQHYYVGAGTYTIKVKAVDTKLAESGWSEPFTIYISSEIMISKPKYIVYDGETSTTNYSSGGGWAAPTGSTLREVTTEYNSYNHSLELSLTWDNWWGGAGYNWAGWWQQNKILNLNQFESVEFWIKVSSIPANAKINFQLKDSTNALTNEIDIIPYLGSNYIGVWKKVEIPLTEFSGIDFSKVWEIQIGVTGVQTGNALLYIDDIGFVYKTSQQPTIYSLSVNINPQGAGSVTLNPSGGTYIAGTTVTLTAVANSGYVFSGWGGDLSGSQNPATIVMNSNKTITAVFVSSSLPQLPQVSLSLNDNEVISGVKNIDVNIDSLVNIQKVLLYIDNICVSTDTVSPYSFELDTTKYNDGTYIIRVEVYDEYNRVVVKEVVVEVNNTVPPNLIKITELKDVIILSPNADGINDEIIVSDDVEEFKIYNTKGKLVEKVDTKFDGKNLAKGVYIYRAKLKNGEVKKGKIVIIK
jgi:hypothetical protein